jgi:hypothetical protein
MMINQDFLSTLVKRFEVTLDETWLRARLFSSVEPSITTVSDPAVLAHELQLNLERIFVPDDQSIRLASWIYAIARGFVVHRYRSLAEYIDVSMTPAAELESSSAYQYVTLNPEMVPIYAVHGLPGVGKSAFVRALLRAFPAPCEIEGEGNPPQRIQTLSACWIGVNTNFSLLNWVKETLIRLGAPVQKGKMNLGALSKLIFKAFYRSGVGALLVDELQFASGRQNANHALLQLLAMRNFGVPIFFFANSDFIDLIKDSRAQIAQRIPREIKLMAPMVRGDPLFQRMLDAQLGLYPYGHDVDVAQCASVIYDIVGGLPRASGRLIELAAPDALRHNRKLSMRDLVAAQHSSSFAPFRQQIALLRSPIFVDQSKYPELASNNELYDPSAAYREQLRNDQIAEAAALALYGSYTDEERERADAIAIEILRRSGKIGSNVAAIGESKNKRSSKKQLEERFRNSYIAQHMSSSVPQNPVTSKDDDSETK